MTVFQLKQLASPSVHAAADAVGWHYDRAELIADGVIHAIGVLCGIIAATVLVVLTVLFADATDIVGVSIYVAGLLSMLVLSATYNLWPVSPAKWLLRRFDHSAIYLLIAATYTPFILEVKDSGFALVLLGRRLVRGDPRHRAEASLPRPVRPRRGRHLPRHGLERRDAL